MLVRVSFGAFLLANLLPLSAQSPATSACQTDSSVVANVLNTAAGITGNYGSSSFLTISGLNLPNAPFAISQATPGTTLAIAVANTMVLVNGTPAYIFSYAAGQLLLLTPQITGCVSLYIEENGVARFQAQLYLNTTAPGLFTVSDGQTVVASHNDWSLVTSSSPAQPGEWISLWAAGLGPVNPPLTSGQVAQFAAQLTDLAHFSVLFNGAAADPSSVEYVGVAPGYAGLYQINVKVPVNVAANPEIRLRTADNISPPQRYLAVAIGP